MGHFGLPSLLERFFLRQGETGCRSAFSGPLDSLEWYLEDLYTGLNAGVDLNRTVYVVLWVFEVLSIIVMVLAMALPIHDYALREFIEWRKHPSSETYRVFIEKQRQEHAVRLIIAVPFGVMAALLTGPLKKYRQKLR